ncbi:hypothetical protein BD626DRAFT_507921 [Schizophyllum amplum]|uniref:Uncharacterized protein n=1 Tax=Schizophyllum amplum TaxID=97359 RepID=A0A550C4B9_9AGAR|nr:hypothetical protein BD626DRAFT_507921 [Auriculariopsis ampla]
MALYDALSMLYPSFNALPIVLLFACILYFALPRIRLLLILAIVLYTGCLILPLLYSYALLPVWRTVLFPVWRVARYVFVPFTFAARMIYRGARLVVLAARQVAIWIAWLGFYVHFGRLGFDYLLDGWDWVYEAARRVGYFFEEMEREGKTRTQAEKAAAAEDDDDDEMPDLEPEEPRRGSTGAGRRGSKKRRGRGR